MTVEFTEHKVTMNDNSYYLSLWDDGTLHALCIENNNIKDKNFTIQQERKFDAMYKSFLAKDYEIVA